MVHSLQIYFFGLATLHVVNEFLVESVSFLDASGDGIITQCTANLVYFYN